METAQGIEYLGVRIDSKDIKQMEGFIPSITISKDSIVQISLIEGSPAQRPIVLVIIGIIVMIIGALPVPGIIKFFIEGGVTYDVVLLWPGLIFIGLLILYEAFRKKLFLQVETTKGQERIMFDGKVIAEELKEFIRMARDDYGYKIQNNFTQIQ